MRRAVPVVVLVAVLAGCASVPEAARDAGEAAASAGFWCAVGTATGLGCWWPW